MNSSVGPESQKNNGKFRFVLREWADTLKVFSGDIQEATTGTEEEFLLIGSRLRDFHKKADNISRIPSSITDLLSGERVVKAIEGLDSILEDMDRQLQHAEKTVEEYIEKIERIIKALKGIYATLDDMDHLAKNMRKLGITIKIWSAPLGRKDAGFRKLAGEVKDLSERINSDTVKISEVLKVTSSRIDQTLATMQKLKASQREHALGILDNTRKALVSLKENQLTFQETVKHISDWTVEITGSIGKVVMSLQFHDITRQEMESVKRAIDDMTRSLQSAYGSISVEGNEPLDSLVRETGDASNLLYDKLSESKEKMLLAVDDVKENLRQISKNVADMTDETQKAAESSYEVEHTFLAKVEEGFGVLFQNAEDVRELSVAVGSTKDIIREITLIVERIEAIGSEIEIVSFNAKVKAIHIGDKGRALQVLADAVRELSQASDSLTQDTAETLFEILSATEELTAGTDAEAEGKQFDIKGLGDEMGNLLNTLRSVNNDIQSHLGKMDEDGQGLSDGIEQLIEGLHIHSMVERLVGGILSGLHDIADYSRYLVPVEHGVGGAGYSESHHTAMKKDTAVLDERSSVDDNVELF